ncbi:MAG: flagellar protein FlaG [Pseudomonadota bacterium]
MDISQISSAAPAVAAERRTGAAPPKVVSAPEAAKAPKPEPDQRQVVEALKNINTALQVRSPDLEFSFDSDSARTIVKVVDAKTHEVIRQMPSEEALQIAKALEHLESLLIRDQA